MSEVSGIYATASTRLCPWLHETLASLTEAHAARGLGHAWLLTGPHGTGKLNLALVLAARLLKADTPSSVGTLSCEDAYVLEHLRRTATDTHPDIHLVFPKEDKRTISVEQIRDASAGLNLKSLRGGAKVMILEPAEAMTTAAANALLKTLEEPTAQTWILLVSHQAGRLPATIRSRCQQMAIAPPAAEQALHWLGGEAQGMRALALAGGCPLRARAWMETENVELISSLEEDLQALCKLKTDPLATARKWLDQDPERALVWLLRTLHEAARVRTGLSGTTRVTDPAQASLHNAWSRMTLRQLLNQLTAVENLLSQLGSGINMELSLGVLLQGLIPAPVNR